jgi:hypothetical protein
VGSTPPLRRGGIVADKTTRVTSPRDGTFSGTWEFSFLTVISVASGENNCAQLSNKINTNLKDCNVQKSPRRTTQPTVTHCVSFKSVYVPHVRSRTPSCHIQATPRCFQLERGFCFANARQSPSRRSPLFLAQRAALGLAALMAMATRLCHLNLSGRLASFSVALDGFQYRE